MEDINVPTQISNIIKDTRVRAEIVRNLKFIYCRRSVNKFVDRITIKVHKYTSQTLCLISLIKILFLSFQK